MEHGLYPRKSGPNSASCKALTSFEAACASATPGFLTLDPAKQYSCLCFTSSTFAPSVYQNYHDGCLSYLSTASPALYSSIGGHDLPPDYCVSASQALATTAAYVAACSSWDSLVSSCAALTPSFTHLSFSRQARCLCHVSSSTYAYDGYFASCLQYFSLVEPRQWSQAGGQNAVTTPCAAARGHLGSPNPTPGPKGTRLSVNIHTTSTTTLSISSQSSAAAASSVNTLLLNAWTILAGAIFVISIIL